MRNVKIYMFIILYAYAIIGIYSIVGIWVIGTDMSSFFPNIDFFFPHFQAYSVLIGLLIASIFAFLQSERYHKILGGLFLFFWLLGLILFAQVYV